MLPLVFLSGLLLPMRAALHAAEPAMPEALIPVVRLPETFGPQDELAADALLFTPQQRRQSFAFVVEDRLHAVLQRGQIPGPSPDDLGPGPWQTLRAGPDGWFQSDLLWSSWVRLDIHTPVARSVQMQISGGGLAYINGEPRSGARYGDKTFWIPVRLHVGLNSVLVRSHRDRLGIRLRGIDRDLLLLHEDALLPNPLPGEQGPLLGSVTLLNAGPAFQQGLAIETVYADGPARRSPAGPIGPGTLRKIPFAFDLPEPFRGDGSTRLPLRLRLLGPDDAELHAIELSVTTGSVQDVVRRTFRSGVDGSVQYYAMRFPQALGPDRRAGMVLSLHGASVEAAGHCKAIRPRADTYVICPTNRRPYGFDWEDWGRLDALEAMDLALRSWPIDPQRVYLTGHSMGGHGNWHLGTLYPDRFAGISPSSAWISIQEMRWARLPREQMSPMQDLCYRLIGSSDTLAHEANLRDLGVHIVVGSECPYAPDSRRMFERLRSWHPDVRFHEQAGAPHWWGTDCADWPPMVQHLAARAIPHLSDTFRVRFRTADIGVAQRAHWASIEQVCSQLAMAEVDLIQAEGGLIVAGTTHNVRALRLDLDGLPMARRHGGLIVHLDLQAPQWVPVPPESGSVLLVRNGRAWRRADALDPREKHAGRFGPFKAVLQRNAVLVYATGGTDQENLWSYLQARHDAEHLAYQGNAGFELVPDAVYLAGDFAGRNVLLYGHDQANRAAAALLDGSPVRVRRGEVRLGEQTLSGDGQLVYLLRPHPDDGASLVGQVALTGGASRVAHADLTAILMSGTQIPDVLVIGEGDGAGNRHDALVAGMFDRAWRLDSSLLVWGRLPAGPGAATQPVGGPSSIDALQGR